MKKYSILILILIILLSLAACNDIPADNPITYNISGYVSLNDKNLLGVQVSLNGKVKTATNANGEFYLNGLTLNTVITFSKTGYSFSPNKITVTKNNNFLHIFASKINQENTSQNGREENEQENTPPIDDQQQDEQPQNNNQNNQENQENQNAKDILNLSFETTDKISLLFYLKENISSYSLIINDNEVFSSNELPTTTSKMVDNVNYYLIEINLDELLSAGENIVKIKTAREEKSLAYTYLPVLAKIENLAFKDSIISWINKNNFETQYKIYINNVFVASSSATNFNTSTIIKKEKENLIKNIKVCASKTNYTDSDFSELILNAS